MIASDSPPPPSSRLALVRRALPWVVVLVGLALYLGFGWLRPLPASDFLAEWPVLSGGRVKPFDTEARTTLMLLSQREHVEIPGATPDARPTRLSATAWLTDALFRPELADTYPVFRVDLRELAGLLGADEKRKHFSFNEIRPHLANLQQMGQRVPEDAALRTVADRAVLRLLNGIEAYLRLSRALTPPIGPDGPLPLGEEVNRYQAQIGPGLAALHQQQAGQPFDQVTLDNYLNRAARFLAMGQQGDFRLIPPNEPIAATPDMDARTARAAGFRSLGIALVDAAADGQIPTYAKALVQVSTAFREGRLTDAQSAADAAFRQLREQYPEKSQRVDWETRLNLGAPFSVSLALYIVVFLVATISWLIWPKALGGIAWWTMLAAFVIHSLALASRTWLQEYPPVTNLYSSAIFIGWMGVFLALVLERFWQTGLASATGALLGLSTLFVAYGLQLQAQGDTMEMMRAVLDSQFWLGTHVITITVGYAATFVAGYLGLLFVGRGLLTRTMRLEDARALEGMVYGTVCFALFFSFVGTVLGGIWADQSWGRFWGWDPKENGALLIVLWNAAILHARWGKVVQRRGLMLMAIVGNIITSWSWFGTNMLGIGLHSYGFMDEAFGWLAFFVGSQLLFIGLGLLPAKFWRSPAALARSSAEAAAVASPAAAVSPSSTAS